MPSVFNAVAFRVCSAVRAECVCAEGATGAESAEGQCAAVAARGAQSVRARAAIPLFLIHGFFVGPG